MVYIVGEISYIADLRGMQGAMFKCILYIRQIPLSFAYTRLLSFNLETCPNRIALLYNNF